MPVKFYTEGEYGGVERLKRVLGRIENGIHRMNEKNVESSRRAGGEYIYSNARRVRPSRDKHLAGIGITASRHGGEKPE